jgi:hypothetical protein
MPAECALADYGYFVVEDRASLELEVRSIHAHRPALPLNQKPGRAGQHKLPVVIIVINNGYLGLIRQN